MAKSEVDADEWPDETLTPREAEIVSLIMAGATTPRQLAATLTVSPRTIRTHLGNIYGKLRVNSMSGLILKQRVKTDLGPIYEKLGVKTMPGLLKQTTVRTSGVELRACNRMLGVLTPGFDLEVKRGDLIITFDLVETLRQQRPVYTARPLPAYDKDTTNVANDLPAPGDKL